MTAPLATVSPTALAYEAFLILREAGVRQLAVRDELGRVVGLLRKEEIVAPERYPLALLSRTIRGARTVEDIAAHRARLPVVLKDLLEVGARAPSAGRAISAVSDVVVERLIGLAEEDLGPAPGRFAFMALGSQGREEQTLVTDQDNAIVYELPPGADPAVAAEWFHALGERVCDGLDRVGYPYCQGGMMAKNPRWSVPLARWKEYFAGWIEAAEPKDVLDFVTFFDFRCVHGDATLAAALRAHVLSELTHAPAVFVQLAQNALRSRPLLGFFGKLVAETDAAGGQRIFNIKDAVSPIVSFARLYALHGGHHETSTFDRLARLPDKGVLTESDAREVVQGYEFLVSLRMRQQLESIGSGDAPTNQIDIGALTEIEEATLKLVCGRIAALQKKISFDFLGGAWAQGV